MRTRLESRIYTNPPKKILKQQVFYMLSGKFNTKNKFVSQENQNKYHFSKHYQSGNESLVD